MLYTLTQFLIIWGLLYFIFNTRGIDDLRHSLKNTILYTKSYTQSVFNQRFYDFTETKFDEKIFARKALYLKVYMVLYSILVSISFILVYFSVVAHEIPFYMGVLTALSLIISYIATIRRILNILNNANFDKSILSYFFFGFLFSWFFCNFTITPVGSDSTPVGSDSNYYDWTWNSVHYILLAKIFTGDDTTSLPILHQDLDFYKEYFISLLYSWIRYWTVGLIIAYMIYFVFMYFKYVVFSVLILVFVGLFGLEFDLFMQNETLLTKLKSYGAYIQDYYNTKILDWVRSYGDQFRDLLEKIYNSSADQRNSMIRFKLSELALGNRMYNTLYTTAFTFGLFIKLRNYLGYKVNVKEQAVGLGKYLKCANWIKPTYTTNKVVTGHTDIVADGKTWIAITLCTLILILLGDTIQYGLLSCTGSENLVELHQDLRSKISI
jgi:hypothetical protein